MSGEALPDRDAWLEAVGLDEDEVPELIILEGTWWERERYHQRLLLLDDVRELNFPKFYWGRYQEQPVMFCCAYGAPRAVEPVHVFGLLGTRKVVQIGSCGALQPEVRTGDIVLPARAVIGEGASQYYGAEGSSEADPALLAAAARAFADAGFPVHQGLHLTTSALFAQPPERVAGWQQAGYLAVDMETSAVYSAARYFGMRAVSLLYAWDELLLGRSFLHTFSTEEQARQQRANEALFPVALSLLEVP